MATSYRHFVAAHLGRHFVAAHLGRHFVAEDKKTPHAERVRGTSALSEDAEALQTSNGCRAVTTATDQISYPART